MNPMEIHIGQGIVGTVAKTGIAEIIKDTSADPRYIKDDAMRFSEIAVPIIYGGEVFGVIDSEHSQKNFFTNRHLQILNTIATLCANKISRARLDRKIISDELEIAEMKRSLAEAKLIALRSQMSPHFIFNSLNAIQHFIFAQQNDEALAYLNKFSKLIRLILQKANDQVISLEDEINMLELYMQLEALRFSDKFEYSIHIDKQINKQATEVPAMMIQPFVEFAINYSLLNKKDKGKLSLDFTQEDDLIHCSVMDNGIARSESESIKNRNEANENDAIENAFKRLATLNAFSEKQSSIEINDLIDKHGVTIGTQVEIILPIEET
jgi:LytS/YehU family sensor histidine kinase